MNVAEGSEIKCLECPNCGGDQLHHGMVTVYDRSEHAEITSVTIVNNGLTATHLRPSKDIRNPSSTRSSITVMLWCEVCDNSFEVYFAHQIGWTILSWRGIE